MVSCAFVGFWAFYFLWCLLLFFHYDPRACSKSHADVHEGARFLRILSPVVALRDGGIGLDLQFLHGAGAGEGESDRESWVRCLLLIVCVHGVAIWLRVVVSVILGFSYIGSAKIKAAMESFPKTRLY